MITERFTFFWGGPLSNWHSSPFVLNGVEYNCVEQFMMAQKALLFRDKETHAKIMLSKSPKEQKALGRKVKSFNVQDWEKEAQGIVYLGCQAKFQQNSELWEYLRSTAGTTLVEASPYDKIWGIGLDAADPRAQFRETWQGRNWLGEVLTRVREDLLNG